MGSRENFLSKLKKKRIIFYILEDYSNTQINDYASAIKKNTRRLMAM